jgi:hypothetical protein
MGTAGLFPDVTPGGAPGAEVKNAWSYTFVAWCLIHYANGLLSVYVTTLQAYHPALNARRQS